MNAHTRQRGVSLIEVLVAVVLMAFGLIGIAAMQTAAISNNVLSGQYTQAATLAQNMAERMRGNRDAVINGSYNFVAGAVGNPPVNCATASCSSANQASWDLAVWYASVAPNVTLSNVTAGPSANLAGGQVSIACTSGCTATAIEPVPKNPIYMITVYWDGDNNGATGTGCDASNASDLRCFRLPFTP